MKRYNRALRGNQARQRKPDGRIVSGKGNAVYRDGTRDKTRSRGNRIGKSHIGERQISVIRHDGSIRQRFACDGIRFIHALDDIEVNADDIHGDVIGIGRTRHHVARERDKV